MTWDDLGASPYALEAKELSVVLGGQQVLGVQSLQVRHNEVMMVIGPNGSGKTTLLLCLASLLKPATGTVSYDGVQLTGANRVQMRRKLAVVFQEPLLLNNSVWENVTVGMRLRGVHKDEIRIRAQKWLERFGVASLAKRRARLLSGGEAKRVSLARAFALQPEVLFLDEPFTALDSPTRQALLEEFESVLRETRLTTVMVTHDHNEALVLGDRVAVLMNGSIAQLGSPQDVFGSPTEEAVAQFVGAGNILHGVVTAQQNGLALIDVQGGQIQASSDLAVNTRVTIYLHNEDITINMPSAEQVPSSARNQLRGTIVKTFPSGSLIRVTIDCGFMLTAVITRRSWEEMGLAMGSKVVASFKASAVHLLVRTGK